MMPESWDSEVKSEHPLLANGFAKNVPMTACLVTTELTNAFP
jgi:hypothetical protein